MTSKEVLKRRIGLKEQAIQVIRDQIDCLELQIALEKVKSNLETQINDTDFDPELSHQLEAIEHLLGLVR